eukprot:4941700-Amphidinium_carterae.1
MSTLVGPGAQGFASPSSWMNKGTLCMSALVGPGVCAIADCCDDDGRQAGPSDTDSWAYASRGVGGKVDNLCRRLLLGKSVCATLSAFE